MTTPARRTRWGGLADGRFERSGRFRLGEDKGVWWLVDPDGGRFLSKGVDTVRFDQDEIKGSKHAPYAEACWRKYGGIEGWRLAAAKRLAGWSFNTLGAWSDEMVAQAGPILAIAPNLDLGMSFAWAKNDQDRSVPRQEFPDVFDPAFAAHVARRAHERCATRREERHILGWFMDNELRWGPDWRGPEELLTLFLNMAPAAPGRRAALDWLKTRHGDAAAPSRADCDDFAALVAERYFMLTSDALRAADPEHLNLGSRFAYPPADTIVQAAARHADVVSFNCYDAEPGKALALYGRCGKPLLIGEFSFRGADAGLPNTRGAGPIVATQSERAAAFRKYAAAAFTHPHIVGVHWFEHADQPAQGRFDGENSNFGTVTIDDRIYVELTAAMNEVNAAAERLHAAAGA